MQCQAHGFPGSGGGPVGSVVCGFSGQTLVPVLPSPTTPSRALVVCLLVPSSQPPPRRKATAGSAPGRRVLAVLFSRLTRGDVPRVWSPSPDPAGPVAAGQHPHLSRQISPPHFCLCCAPCLRPGPLSHLPGAILSPGSERCQLLQLRFESPL